MNVREKGCPTHYSSWKERGAYLTVPKIEVYTVSSLTHFKSDHTLSKCIFHFRRTFVRSFSRDAVINRQTET